MPFSHLSAIGAPVWIVLLLIIAVAVAFAEEIVLVVLLGVVVLVGVIFWPVIVQYLLGLLWLGVGLLVGLGIVRWVNVTKARIIASPAWQRWRRRAGRNSPEV